jgi:phosphonate transport system substrate-binding protein
MPRQSQAAGLDRPTSRRWFIRAVAGGVLASPAIVARAASPATFGLTPVFLDSDLELLTLLEAYLSESLGREVSLVKRRTYQEMTALLLSGQIDAAWICGFPYVQYRERLSLVAVPTYQGQGRYQSYIIVNASDATHSVADLRGKIHAFSDPDSNSGFLVTRHLLATMGESPASFFANSFYTYGHRNVIRAVAAGLAQSGSVDGYVWEVMADLEPGLTRQTRVIRKSEWLGFPPVACNRNYETSANVRGLGRALLTMSDHPRGRRVLEMLRLDRFSLPVDALFDGIAAKYEVVRKQL